MTRSQFLTSFVGLGLLPILDKLSNKKTITIEEGSFETITLPVHSSYIVDIETDGIITYKIENETAVVIIPKNTTKNFWNKVEKLRKHYHIRLSAKELSLANTDPMTNYGYHDLGFIFPKHSS